MKSNFDKDFKKKNRHIYDNLLKVSSIDKDQIHQEFFDSSEIISQFSKDKPQYSKKNKSINEDKTQYSKIKKLINVIIDDLLSNNEVKTELFSPKIIYNKEIYNPNQINNYLEFLKEIINENEKEEKYYSRNIPFSTMNISRLANIDIPKINIFPNILELEKLSSKDYYRHDNSMEEIILYVRNLLSPLFRKIMPPNAVSGKIPCSSGGSLSIQGIKKWICSGFTYSYIFEKQGGKNKKKYNFAFIIDLSQSALLLCNFSHAIATIVLLLIAPSTVEDNEEIFIDVVFNSIHGIKIICYNSKCSIFQNLSKINEIIEIIKNEVNFSCCPGSCVYTAYKLLLERRESKKIILITDGFVSDRNEIELILSLIQRCENEGIDFITVGVGAFPNGINDIYPNYCYSPSIRKLNDALSSSFILSKECDSNYIKSNLFFTNQVDREKLSKIIREEPKDEKLKNSINNTKIKTVDMISNKNISFSTETINKSIENPEEEPYYDIFEIFKILIVILYLGNDKHDKNITTEIFEENAGKALKKKGFKYDIVYSYGEAIKKLTSVENENCPYSEVWIFCSKGDGSLPDKAEDKDSNKITMFLEVVADYNKNGGALFLFCDNYPFVLEANLLLKKYIKFEEGKINFEMKGSYNNENPKERFIYVEGTQKAKNGFFRSENFLESPGKAERLSLRIGLNKFSEGITLSYAETFDNSENYAPFTPFAYLSDPTKLRPFILYYDPKINNKEISRGPIVVHGGFTSAFYDFQQDGTGRLVISIACWLIRKEEFYLDLNKNKIKKIPKINKPSLYRETFNQWITIKSNNMFSILILDISASMEKYYDSLIDMANNIIQIQQKNDENEGVVIFFGSQTKTIINREYRLLNREDITSSKVSIGTDFVLAFREAEKYIYNKNNFTNKRILFLTDGLNEIIDDSQLQPITERIKKENFKINIVGFENSRKSSYYFDNYDYLENIDFEDYFSNENVKKETSFEHLRKFASENCFFTSTNFKEVEEFCKKVFAAE